MDLPDFLAQDTDGFLHLRGHRIGIQHVVHFYDEGYSAEMLAEEFPTLSLALIHKTIGFYLENRADIDACIAHNRDESHQMGGSVRHPLPSHDGHSPRVYN